MVLAKIQDVKSLGIKNPKRGIDDLSSRFGFKNVTFPCGQFNRWRDARFFQMGFERIRLSGQGSWAEAGIPPLPDVPG